MDERADGAVADEVAGTPAHRREIGRGLWKQVATEITSEAAAAVVDVSPAV
jgi:hypothetical protein